MASAEQSNLSDSSSGDIEECQSQTMVTFYSSGEDSDEVTKKPNKQKLDLRRKIEYYDDEMDQIENCKTYEVFIPTHFTSYQVRSTDYD